MPSLNPAGPRDEPPPPPELVKGGRLPFVGVWRRSPRGPSLTISRAKRGDRRGRSARPGFLSALLGRVMTGVTRVGLWSRGRDS